MSNYPDGFDSAACDQSMGYYGSAGPMPDEVRVCLDEIYLEPHIISTSNLWAEISTESGSIDRFTDDKGRTVEVRASYRAIVNEWLTTPDGQRDLQFWIDKEMGL